MSVTETSGGDTEYMDIDIALSELKEAERQLKELEKLRLREKELREELESLRKPVGFDSKRIQVENALRRAYGLVREKEIEYEIGGREAHATKVYYDAYQAYVKWHPKDMRNPNYRGIRVFDLDGSILEEDGILLVHLNAFENFWPNDTVYVEPSAHKEGKWELVGEYNIKGKRIG